jgi:spore germination cell wall hydrolase CwlJ-like protein
MLFSLRSAMLIFAALSASSVAPAQVHPSAEPLLPLAAVTVPKTVVVTPLDVPAPAADDDADKADPVAPSGTPSEAAPKPRTSTDLAAMVADLRSSDPGNRELECLAVGIYYESKSEPLVGQLAVGEVIANRANSKGRFPSSYCGVLFQRGQFSFIRGARLPSVPRASRQWQTAVAVAKIVDQDLKDSAADDALFFHAKRVSPGWRLKRVASIGNHIFYR